jgi:glycosyltransferase involved in cell wall biosynthesis
MRKICHITTVHPRFDVRIFHKECKSLSKIYNVTLLVADGQGDETVDGIRILDVGLRQTSRLKRAIIDSKKALKKAIELDCDIYHFHDPELIKIGVKLKKKGKKVIYDTHEDLPRQIMGKPYLNKFIKPILASLIEWQENKAAKQFDYICSATPHIRDRFKEINKNTIDINNYPIIGELELNTREKISNKICYTGGISEERGVAVLINALEFTNAKLEIAGNFYSEDFKNQLNKNINWEKVNYLGLVGRDKVAEIISTSIAGIVTFLPLPNHVNAQPNKMFEYMSSGTAVIAADYPLWKEIIEKNNCGICVNPNNPKEIAEAINELINNSDKAVKMGQNGKNAVKNKYNWNIEEQKLFEVYKQI